MKYIYGPVYSWRLGVSLGIDLLSQDEKVCNFNCTYCQVGRTVRYTVDRKICVPTEKIIKELKTLPQVHIDYITFSGRGEPTLAKNLGETIKAIKEIRQEPVAVLTNSALICRKDVQDELLLADLVECKLDAPEAKMFGYINKADKGINFLDIINGIQHFRNIYKGKLALQIMFVRKNMKEAASLAQLIKTLKPDEVHINTPLRPPAKDVLSEKEIREIKKHFSGYKIKSVYDKPRQFIKPINVEDTIKRRGGFVGDLGENK